MELVTSVQDAATGTCASDQRELVAGCLRADSTSWDTVIRRHGPQISRLVHRYASLRGEVDDIKQEVFLRVFCKLSTFRVDDGNLGSWITRIGRNLVFDRLRQKKPLLQSCAREELEELAGHDHGWRDPENAAIANEASRMLRESMRLLSSDVAETVALRFLGGMKYNEIAEALRVPRGTVKSRLKHGRDRLFKRLDHAINFTAPRS